MRPLEAARALIEAHRTGREPPRAALAWAAEGMALHLQQGISLQHALGLVRHGGGGGCAMVERRQQRDDLLREVHRRYFAELTPRAAARAIVAALARQERARGRTIDDLARLLEVLLHFDPSVPRPDTIRRLLAENGPF